MPRVPLSALVLAVAVILTTGCKHRNPLWCDAETPCPLAERPFCDLEGVHPGSDGLPNSCVPDPGLADAGGGGDANVPDAARPCLPEVAFLSERDGSRDVYRSDLEGTQQISLTGNIGRNLEFVWSPDGSRIVVMRDFELWVVNADGSNLLQITDGVSGGLLSLSPTWSPDGDEIAFVRTTGEITPVSDIWKIAATGGIPNRLTHAVGDLQNFAPSWSPDGTRIAFARRHGESFGIYAIAPDGSGEQELASDPSDVFPDVPWLSWSPAGDRLMYLSTGTGNYEIWDLASDGSDRRNLTNSNGNETEPTWWPDGSKIVYSREDAIYVMNANGSGQRILANLPNQDEEARVSPAGDKLAWASFFEGNWEVYVAEADGSNPTRITSNGQSVDDRRVAWRPCP